MKRLLFISAATLILSACSTTTNYVTQIDNPGSATSLQSQRLSTSFVRKGIKLEWECVRGTGTNDTGCKRGDIRSIEITDYAASFGNSDVNLERAFRIAEMKAKARLRHFVSEDINSSQVKSTLSKHVEKANSSSKQHNSANEEVAMNDNEAAGPANRAVQENKLQSDVSSRRENTSDTVETLTETVRINAAGILRGLYIKESRVVDRQTVEVTLRWDKDSEGLSDYLRNRFR